MFYLTLTIKADDKSDEQIVRRVDSPGPSHFNAHGHNSASCPSLPENDDIAERR
jgi:hypothetical protein